MAGFAVLGSHPLIWRSAMTLGVVKDMVPMLDKMPVPYLGSWLKSRTLPKWRGGKFRSWMKTRNGRGPKT
jgi:L-lactate dehydrogenase complex protein LldF